VFGGKPVSKFTVIREMMRKNEDDAVEDEGDIGCKYV
jgi:hypothetical protein